MQLPLSSLRWGELSYTDLYALGLYIMKILCISYMRVAFVPLVTFHTFQLFCLSSPFPATASLSTACPPASRTAAEATQLHRPSPPSRAGLHTLKQLTCSVHLFNSEKATLVVSAWTSDEVSGANPAESKSSFQFSCLYHRAMKPRLIENFQTTFSAALDLAQVFLKLCCSS